MENQRINWRNLRRNKCPKCSSEIEQNPANDMIECSNIICKFRVSAQRFKEIVSGMNKETLDVPFYQQGEEVEDLAKHSWPDCSFCGSRHDPNGRCEGFG